MQASATLIRITPPRIRMRISAPTYDFQRLKKIIKRVTTLPLGRKRQYQMSVGRGFPENSQSEKQSDEKDRRHI